MKKKLLIYLLSSVISFGYCIPTYAECKLKTIVDSKIELNYVNVNYVTYSLDIEGNEAYYGITIKTDSASKIIMYMELQKKSGSTWAKVTSSTKTNYSSNATFDDSYNINSSEMYRVYFKTTVYYGNNQKEIVTNYKY